MKRSGFSFMFAQNACRHIQLSIHIPAQLLQYIKGLCINSSCNELWCSTHHSHNLKKNIEFHVKGVWNELPGISLKLLM